MSSSMRRKAEVSITPVCRRIQAMSPSLPACNRVRDTRARIRSCTRAISTPHCRNNHVVHFEPPPMNQWHPPILFSSSSVTAIPFLRPFHPHRTDTDPSLPSSFNTPIRTPTPTSPFVPTHPEAQALSAPSRSFRPYPPRRPGRIIPFSEERWAPAGTLQETSPVQDPAVHKGAFLPSPPLTESPPLESPNIHFGLIHSSTPPTAINSTTPAEGTIPFGGTHPTVSEATAKENLIHFWDQDPAAQV